MPSPAASLINLNGKKGNKRKISKAGNSSKDVYEVENIVDKRIYNKKIQYLLKWKNYSNDHNTWESVESLNCPKIIEEFEAKRKESVEMEEKENRKKTKASNKEVENLSEYEKLVEKNRMERLLFLQSLIDNPKEELKNAIGVLKPVHKVRVWKVYEKCRESKRLKKSEEDKMRLKINEKDKTPIQKLPQFSFADVLLNKEDNCDFLDSLPKTERREEINYKENFDFKNLKFKKYVRSYSKPSMLNCSLITAFLPSSSINNVIVALGWRNGILEFFNLSADSNFVSLAPHTMQTTNLKFNPGNPQQLVISSSDGTVLCGDLETKLFNRVHKGSEYFTNFDFLSSTSLLVVNPQRLFVTDTRINSDESKEIYSFDHKNIGCVSVHPVKRDLFITASSSSMRLWDMRMLSKTPLFEIPQHDAKIFNVHFSPGTGDSIVSTSHRTLSIFDSSEIARSRLSLRFSSTLEVNIPSSCRHLRATWLPNSDIFAVGNVSHPGTINIYNDKGEVIQTFVDEILKAQSPRSGIEMCVFHPFINAMVCVKRGSIYFFSEH